MTTPNGLTPEVSQAIQEIRIQFTDIQVVVRPDGDGGGYVIVESVPLSEIYLQTETWMGFHITYLYPDADVYPLFVRPDLTRVDGRPLGQGTSLETFEGQPAQQISRRSNHRNVSIDTAVLKLLKVLEWLNTHQ